MINIPRHVNMSTIISSKQCARKLIEKVGFFKKQPILVGSDTQEQISVRRIKSLVLELNFELDKARKSGLDIILMSRTGRSVAVDIIKKL